MHWLESPALTTAWLRNLDEKFVLWLSSLFNCRPLLFFGISVGIQLYIYSLGQIYIGISTAAVAIGAFTYIRFGFNKKIYLYLLLLLSFLIFLLDFRAQMTHQLLPLFGYLLFFFFPFVFILLSRRWNLKLRLFILIIIPLIECYLGYQLQLRHDSLKALFFVSPLRTLLIYTYVIFEDMENRYSLKSPQTWLRIFNPSIILLFGFRRADLENPAPSNYYFVKGMKNIYLSLLYYYLNKYFLSSVTENNFALENILIYPKFYFTFASVSLYFFGLLQIMGFQINDPYDFPFLAHNPLERWKRWNVYTTRWYRNMIFVPMYRWTKNIFISVFVTFFANAVIHLRKFDVGKIISGNLYAFNDTDVVRTIAVFLLQGVAVLFVLYFPKLFGTETKKTGWFGVGLTWALLTGIYMIRPR